MNSRDPKHTLLQFNECINNRDLDGLAQLMTEDHVFVDRDGNAHQPKTVMLEEWRRFFQRFPEYRNTCTRIESKDELGVALGYAHWSKERPYDPAIWTASVVDDRVREWRVHDDTRENRLAFHLL